MKHKTDNILECVPLENQEAVREGINQIFYGATSLEQAKLAIVDFKLRYNKVYPSAVECLERDLDQCRTYYLFPVSHWRRIRTSNCLERMNLEIKRRIKSIGRHPAEDGCLALVYRIKKTQALQWALLSFFSVGFFLAVREAETAIPLSLLSTWVFGALFGGFVSFQLAWRARWRIHQYLLR